MVFIQNVFVVIRLQRVSVNRMWPTVCVCCSEWLSGLPPSAFWDWIQIPATLKRIKQTADKWWNEWPQLMSEISLCDSLTKIIQIKASWWHLIWTKSKTITFSNNSFLRKNNHFIKLILPERSSHVCFRCPDELILSSAREDFLWLTGFRLSLTC